MSERRVAFAVESRGHCLAMLEYRCKSREELVDELKNVICTLQMPIGSSSAVLVLACSLIFVRLAASMRCATAMNALSIEKGITDSKNVNGVEVVQHLG